MAGLGARRVGEPSVDALEVDRYGGEYVAQMGFLPADVA